MEAAESSASALRLASPLVYSPRIFSVLFTFLLVIPSLLVIFSLLVISSLLHGHLFIHLDSPLFSSRFSAFLLFFCHLFSDSLFSSSSLLISSLVLSSRAAVFN